MELPRLWPHPLDKCMVSSQAMLCIYLFRGPINYARQPNDGRALYAVNEMNQFLVISLLCDHKSCVLHNSAVILSTTKFVGISSSSTSVNFARNKNIFYTRERLKIYTGNNFGIANCGPEFLIQHRIHKNRPNNIMELVFRVYCRGQNPTESTQLYLSSIQNRFI